MEERIVRASRRDLKFVKTASQTVDEAVAKLGSLEVKALTPDTDFSWVPESLDTTTAVEFFQAPYPLQQVPVANTDGITKMHGRKDERIKGERETDGGAFSGRRAALRVELRQADAAPRPGPQLVRRPDFGRAPGV